MESIESTNNYLLDTSIVNATTTLLYGELEEWIEIPVYLMSVRILFLIVFGLITVTGLVGNFLTVAVILRHKSIKSITDILVLTLAITDILCIVFGVPRLIFISWVNYIMVGHIDYVIYACNYASIYVLVLISLDKYIALVHPIRAMTFRTKRICYIQLIIIWSIALLGNMPLLFENQFCSAEEKRTESCIRILLICNFVLQFMMLLLLMCILYGHILKLFHNAKIPGENNTTNRVRLISNRRVTKMVIIAMIVFIICRLPYHIMAMYTVFVNNVKHIGMLIILYMVSLCMLYLNCCINPILYRFHSKTFRKDFRDVLRCKT